MEKKFNKFEIATIKRVAKTVMPIVLKKQKIQAKIDTLKAQIEELDKSKEEWEAPIVKMTGGYCIEDLVHRTVNENKIAEYNLKYPKTIIPDCNEPDTWISEVVEEDNIVNPISELSAPSF